MSNSTNYPLTLKNKLNSIEFNKDEEFVQYHQFLPLQYIINNDSSRGLLVYHSPGTGKSILAASIADYYRKHYPDKKIIILASKSLQDNMKNNIRKYMRYNPENRDDEKNDWFINNTLEKKYNFVSLNASNMYEQLTKIRKSKQEIELEKKIGIINNDSNKNLLENSILIIDEFHNLSNSITNKSKNSVKLYNTIMNTKNIKLVFLTGTPIINNPFEIVPTFNLLKGYIFEDNKKMTLFPEDKDDFYKYFVNSKEFEIKNKNKFENRIFGLVSYYGDLYFDKVGKEGFPEQLPLKIEKMSMSDFQYSRYMDARDLEKEEESKKYKKGTSNELGFVKDDNAGTSYSSYRIRSRQISNYSIPFYALEKKSKARYASVKKNINRITPKDLKNVEYFSPKFERILGNIKSHIKKKQLGVVYSEFVHGEGLALFSKVLEQKENYVYWAESRKFDLQIDEYDIGAKGGVVNENTYAIISGDISFQDREKIIKIFNSKENKYGNLINLLLLSKSGAEGLSLKNVRHLHIMEPFWNWARIEQVMARAVRYMSHTSLPKNEQNVKPYIYISTYPKDIVEKEKKKSKIELEPRTTDEEILFSSINNKRLINTFNYALIESSIDCSLHYDNLEQTIQSRIDCKLCTPTGENLYNPDFYKDMRETNNCKKLEQSSLDVKEIKLPKIDETFYYYLPSSKNIKDLKIFHYNKDVDGYIPMKKSLPYYAEIVKKILKL